MLKRLMIIFALLIVFIFSAISQTVADTSIFQNNIQTFTISGFVSNANTGKPLSGVNIAVKGTPAIITTDQNGFYSIQTNKGSVIVYSFTGYKPISFKVRRQREISVALFEKESSDDIVVVGYGTQKRENVVGSVSQISGETVRQNMRGSGHDLRKALIGIPGVTIIP
jgi:hypothetical protein